MAIKFKSVSEPTDYGARLVPGARSLAPYAASAVPSRGRQHQESECTARSPFQRDRDRILHATSGVLPTRLRSSSIMRATTIGTWLTSTLEVAQIARTIARQLRLDEDLAEALALAHDLGHSPFGHAGERALDTAMLEYAGSIIMRNRCASSPRWSANTSILMAST